MVGELELALELRRAALERFEIAADVIEQSIAETRRRVTPHEV